MQTVSAALVKKNETCEDRDMSKWGMVRMVKSWQKTHTVERERTTERERENRDCKLQRQSGVS